MQYNPVFYVEQNFCRMKICEKFGKRWSEFRLNYGETFWKKKPNYLHNSL